MEGLHNKVVVVAGAALGIGATTPLKLAQCGAKVVADINENGAGANAQSIRAAGGSAIPFWFDIADEQSIARMIDHAVDEYGQLDGLHNNVADVPLTRDTNLLDVDLAVWERMLRVSLTGTFLTMRHAVRQMLKQGGRRDREHRYGIRCNAVAPALSRQKARLLRPGRAMLNGCDGNRHARENVAHSHRDDQAEEVAAVVALMLPDEGSWTNGQCFSVDGGWLFR